MGFSLAWCATERELIVAMAPQSIMAYLQHSPNSRSLTSVPQVGRLITAADGPWLLAHIDTANAFELLYPFVPLAASFNLGPIAGNEQPLPLDAIPSAPAIRRHLVPGTATLRRTRQGLELISRQPLPGTGLIWTAAFIMENPQTFEQQLVSADQYRHGANPIGPVAVPAASVGPTTTTPGIATVGPAPPVETTPGAAPAQAYAPAPGYGLPIIGPVGQSTRPCRLLTASDRSGRG